MQRISKAVLAESILAVSTLDMHQKELLADDVHRNQPNLLMAVLAQRRLSASLDRVETLLTILLVCYCVMERSGYHWPIISDALQQQSVDRLAGRIQFTHGMSPDLRTAAVTDELAGHMEPWLLAYVFDQLTQTGIAAMTHEADKYAALAALSLVDTIAMAAAERISGLTAGQVASTSWDASSLCSDPSAIR